MAKILIPTPLRPFTGNQANLITEGSTAGECLNNLASMHPEIREQIFHNDGSLKTFVVVYLEDEDIRHLNGMETPVTDTSVLSIVPAIAGGR